MNDKKPITRQEYYNQLMEYFRLSSQKVKNKNLEEEEELSRLISDIEKARKNERKNK